MKRVYVAGAYSDDNVLGVLKNIGRGEVAAAELFALGYAPFTPWHDKDFVIKLWDEDLIVEMFQELSMAWLRVSEAVYIIPNHKGLRDWQDSIGVKAEIAEAERLGIPVFYTACELHKHFNESDYETG